MPLSGWAKFLKYFIFVSTIVHLCLAVFLIGMDIYIMCIVEEADAWFYEEFATYFIWFFIALCGAYGSFKENIKLLYAYAGSLITFFLIRLILRLIFAEMASTIATLGVNFIGAFLPINMTSLQFDLSFSIEAAIYAILAFILVVCIKKQQQKQDHRTLA